MYAIAKKKRPPQLPISMGVQSLYRLRLPWLVLLDRSRSPRSAITVAQVQSTDVRLCYQRLRVFVCCTTISRKLGQGRLQSGGLPLFIVNHRSSFKHTNPEDVANLTFPVDSLGKTDWRSRSRPKPVALRNMLLRKLKV